MPEITLKQQEIKCWINPEKELAKTLGISNTTIK